MQLLQLKIYFACHSNLLCDGLPAVALLAGLQWFATLQRSSVVSTSGCWQPVSNVAVKAFSRHLWYLTLEMVPLSLFSCKLNEMEKLELADCLLALTPKEPIPFSQCQNGTGYGKPSFWRLVFACPLAKQGVQDLRILVTIAHDPKFPNIRL